VNTEDRQSCSRRPSVVAFNRWGLQAIGDPKETRTQTKEVWTDLEFSSHGEVSHDGVPANLGKFEIRELWWMIGSEEWCSGHVTRRQSKVGRQFIEIDHRCYEFGQGWAYGWERVSHWSTATVALSGVRTLVVNGLSTASSHSVITTLSTWHDYKERRTPVMAPRPIARQVV
jgi:hypothetical protein